MSETPTFYTVVNALIAEIANQRGEDPEEFRQSLLAKIKDGMDADTSTLTQHAAKNDTHSNTEVYRHE